MNTLFHKLATNVIKRQTSSSGVKYLSSRATRAHSIHSIDPGGYLLLIIPGATFTLGCWQVKRRKWKVDLIHELEEKTTAEPIDLPEDLDELSRLEYRKVKLRGKYDTSAEIYITPRSLVTPGKEPTGGGLITAGNRSSVGSWVVAPFEVSDRNIRILVNRGWVPRSRLDPKTRAEGQIQEEIELVGVVRHEEKRQPFGAKNDPNSKQWNYRDVEGMAQKLDTLPVFLDADFKSTVPGGPIGGQTRISLRNEHFSYILTWYSLSVFTLYIWYQKFAKKVRIL